ncbi:MAG: thermonuclease family protein [Desulfobulbus sp.]|nr:thermonuclease family protein [Desulfobulbus sp.]
MIRFLLVILTLVSLSSPCFAYSGKVVSIYDGDSITLFYKGKKLRISLYGIDAPELKQEHGAEARDFLDSFINNETVAVNPIGKLRKGRLTGTVLLGEDNINELMILNGQAWVDRQTCTEEFCTTWIKMEEAAKATKKGLWNNPEATPPWEFRKTGPGEKVTPQKAHIKNQKH